MKYETIWFRTFLSICTLVAISLYAYMLLSGLDELRGNSCALNDALWDDWCYMKRGQQILVGTSFMGYLFIMFVVAPIISVIIAGGVSVTLAFPLSAVAWCIANFINWIVSDISTGKRINQNGYYYDGFWYRVYFRYFGDRKHHD